MVQIAPFEGLRYNPNAISFISRVVAPPYDMIGADAAHALRERDRHNVVRLILGASESIPRSPGIYRDAARHLDNWRMDRILITDRKPAIYVCQQEFTIDGVDYVRRGLICAVLLDESANRSILPHERTMSAPKEDRFQLMKACRAALSPIFMIHSDRGGRASQSLTQMTHGFPTYEFRDREDVVHKLWAVTDRGAISRLASLLKEETMVIADGHHRYATALRCRDECRSGDGPFGSAPEDYAFVFCVSSADAGLRVLPTHRLAKANGNFHSEEFAAALSRYFDCRQIQVPGATRLAELFRPYQNRGPCIGCYVRQQRLLVLRAIPNAVPEALLTGVSEPLRCLPVALLHKAILEPFFAIPATSTPDDPRLAFSQDAEDMFWSVESTRYDAAFLLPPIDPSAIVRIAQAGDLMPPKSTFFYPKIPSGLLFYAFEGGRHVPKIPGD